MAIHNMYVGMDLFFVWVFFYSNTLIDLNL